MEYDLHNNIKQTLAFATAVIATDTTTAGIIIDTAGFESMEYIIQSAAITDGAYAFKLEDGDDAALADAADVSSNHARGNVQYIFRL